MSRLWVILFLLAVWSGFSNDFHFTNLLLGLVISLCVHWLVVPKKFQFKINIYHLLILIAYTVWELIRSSMQVAWDILTPGHKSQPKLIKIPLSCEHIHQISLLANLISLAPGTLAVDVLTETNELVIHVMFAQDQQKTIEFVKHTLEPKILKVFQYV